MYHLGSTLAALGEKLGADATERSLQALLSGSHGCYPAARLVHKDNLQQIIELLKSPTCSSWGRDHLIERIGEVTGEVFGRKLGGRSRQRRANETFRADLWTFIVWAEKQGYQPGRPPTAPP